MHRRSRPDGRERHSSGPFDPSKAQFTSGGNPLRSKNLKGFNNSPWEASRVRYKRRVDFFIFYMKRLYFSQDFDVDPSRFYDSNHDPCVTLPIPF
ncbi:hypothetical protein EVAR_54382_1 [Eumeta japonica]|uniref:Uncharacterized protein n=1 Tax=Eumeta variegata TaxID=151549 RepID=A0A4C1Y5F4_EUMVA|nr:hypothetical protein EVAR_54382_1 [Eumeta japonica]